jgi:hypothetical protein
MKITIETDDLLVLMYLLDVRLDTLSTRHLLALDESTAFSKKFLLKAAWEEPMHVQTQNSLDNLVSMAESPTNQVGEQVWKGLMV